MSRVLVTGGLGFIGSNVVLDRLRRADVVRILDNASRPGTEVNRQYLEEAEMSERLEFVDADVRDIDAVMSATAGVDAVIHLAAQVAVTSSVDDPRLDFEVNALGTLNVLEAARRQPSPPAVIFASTNKVYGELATLAVECVDDRWRYVDHPHGVSEAVPLDFHSPYGCSKGSADQYVLDYARIYGLRTICFRQSCIYGPFQRGTEDQGWVAHFAVSALREAPVTIYGDGRQVRDVLHVRDLVHLYDRALRSIDRVAGEAYNVGGGPDNAISIHGCIDELRRATGREIVVGYADWRPGDQRVFVSDNRKLARDLAWRPVTRFGDGIAGLVSWLEHDLARAST